MCKGLETIQKASNGPVTSVNELTLQCLHIHLVLATETSISDFEVRIVVSYMSQWRQYSSSSSSSVLLLFKHQSPLRILVSKQNSSPFLSVSGQGMPISYSIYFHILFNLISSPYLWSSSCPDFFRHCSSVFFFIHPINKSTPQNYDKLQSKKNKILYSIFSSTHVSAWLAINR